MELLAGREGMHVSMRVLSWSVYSHDVSHEYYRATGRSKQTTKTVLLCKVMVISLFC